MVGAKISSLALHDSFLPGPLGERLKSTEHISLQSTKKARVVLKANDYSQVPKMTA